MRGEVRGREVLRVTGLAAVRPEDEGSWEERRGVRISVDIMEGSQLTKSTLAPPLVQAANVRVHVVYPAMRVSKRIDWH